jgi:hypothetical protein
VNVWLQTEAEERDVQALTAHGGLPLKRTLTAAQLVALGIGAIIGAGIFVLTGHAAATNAGPAIVLSFERTWRFDFYQAFQIMPVPACPIVILLLNKRT